MSNFFKKNQNLLLGITGILFVLSIWQLGVNLKLITPFFVSSPLDVISEDINFIVSGSIYPHFLASFYEFIAGFSLALIFGLICGFIFGWYKRVGAFSRPITYALYVTPIVAIIPLVILWYGLGIWSKAVIIFLASFFPILIIIEDAVKNIDPELLKLAKSFKASNFKILTQIAFPYVVPSVLSGIRIAIPRGIIGMVVGEFYTGNIGLGYLISYYGSSFQTARLLAVILILIFISIFLTLIIDLIEKNVNYRIAK